MTNAFATQDDLSDTKISVTEVGVRWSWLVRV